MHIERLKVYQFRNHPEQEIFPHRTVNVFYGENGAGKTNLLEAVHFCAVGRSHRTNQDRECVSKDQKYALSSVDVRKNTGKHSISVQLKPDEERKKTVYLDRSRAARLSEMMSILQCVMFSPEDLQLVKGSPSLRRRWLDMMISQTSRDYFIALQRYHRGLDQRNALIRQLRLEHRGALDMLGLFEKTMAENGEIILAERKRFLSEIQREARSCYERISGRTEEQFQLRYLSCAKEQDKAASVMQKRWEISREEDIQRGTTLFGPHREDIGLSLRDRDMRLFASQGQCRTAVLSLKLAQMAVFEALSGEKPVLLLDDVMSELDLNRRARLLEEIKGYQTFITCTDLSDLEGCEYERCYQVTLNSDGTADVRMTQSGLEFEGDQPKENDLDPDFS